MKPSLSTRKALLRRKTSTAAWCSAPTIPSAPGIGRHGGLDTLLLVLEGLHQELGEDKYRPAPLLRKMVRPGTWAQKWQGVLRLRQVTNGIRAFWLRLVRAGVADEGR